MTVFLPQSKNTKGDNPFARRIFTSVKLTIKYLERNMKYTIPVNLTTSLFLCIIGIFCGANVAIAQEKIEKVAIQFPLERIEVKSTYIIKPSQRAENIQLKQIVSIADFDLTKQVDVTKLNSRIESVAKELCQKLSDMFPFKPSNKVELKLCKRKAIARTKIHTERAIQAANE